MERLRREEVRAMRREHAKKERRLRRFIRKLERKEMKYLHKLQRRRRRRHGRGKINVAAIVETGTELIDEFVERLGESDDGM